MKGVDVYLPGDNNITRACLTSIVVIRRTFLQPEWLELRGSTAAKKPKTLVQPQQQGWGR